MKTRRFLTFVFMITTFLAAYGQVKNKPVDKPHKLILYNGSKKSCIKNGQFLGITGTGEKYTYTGWKNICTCDSTARQSFWIVDSIGSGSIGLVRYKYSMSYRLDTISGNKRAPKKPGYSIQKVLPPETEKQRVYKVVYKVPVVAVSIDTYETLNYTTIESFTFSHENPKKCLNKMEKIHFDYSWANNTGAKKGPAVIVVIATVVAEAIAAPVVNSTIFLSEKANSKKERLIRYDLKDWKIKVK